MRDPSEFHPCGYVPSLWAKRAKPQKGTKVRPCTCRDARPTPEERKAAEQFWKSGHAPDEQEGAL